MSDRLSLETLPREVIHQIFSLLPAPTLASLRLTTTSLHGPATASSHWRAHTLELLPLHSALEDIAAIPPAAWSFSHAPDGWFRAYKALIQTSRTEWLYTDAQLKGSTWTVFFKAFLTEAGARGDPGDSGWHALVCLREDMTSQPLQGLPLNISRWHVDESRHLRFSGYPPFVPSRDPNTWCRIMQHLSVLMVTDAPEFLAALLALDASILAGEANTELDAAVETALAARQEGFAERLRKLHLERSSAVKQWMPVLDER